MPSPTRSSPEPACRGRSPRSLPGVLKARRAEIEQDLPAARQARDEATHNLAEAELRVMSFEFLLSLGAEGAKDAPERMKLHDAMAHVLASVPDRRMPAGDPARETNRRGLYK